MDWRRTVKPGEKFLDDSFLKDKPQEMKDQLDLIIDQLKKIGLHHNSQDIEAMIILWLKSIIERFANLNGSIDFSKLSEADKSKIMQEIESLVNKLNKSGVAIGSDEIQKLLIEGIFQCLGQLHQKQMKEYDYEFLTEKDKKRIKEELIRAAIYELYKILNPHRIAGETKMQNYINNVLVGGLNYASKFEGGRASDLKSYGLDSIFVDKLVDAHKANIKDPTALREHYGDVSKSPPTKGGGWER